MTQYRSTDVKYFVQRLTPDEAEGDGEAGYIETPDGSAAPLYHAKQANPPTAYHIETSDKEVAHWLVLQDGEIEDYRITALTDDAKVYIVDAVLAGMLEMVA